MTKSLVGCDGPHSMTRQSLTSGIELHVLPYVVFNGKRRISTTQFMSSLHKYMHDSVLIQTYKGDIRLEVSINDIASSYVDLSYNYSRPARTTGSNRDPLHSPDRPVAGATSIPEEFYEELVALQGLEPLFEAIFDAETVREDRVLHWLMRSVRPSQSEAHRLASHGVILIGDAAHATPILGGEGANMAIRDGIELAEHITTSGTDAWADFSESRLRLWTELVESSERQIKDMHVSKTPHL